MRKFAIIVAGGAGSRMGADIPKQFLLLRNKPLLWHTVTAFLTAYEDIRIILVLPESHLDKGREIAQSTSSHGQIIIVEGGLTRFHSVQNGLTHVPSDSIVFVHDGVRCLVTTRLIQQCYEATLARGNAIPCVSAIDTIRIETLNGNELIERSKVKIIQTPQTFTGFTLKKAYQQDYQELFTDDASVVESLGEKIHLVVGDFKNIKITSKIDLLIAEQILIEREAL